MLSPLKFILPDGVTQKQLVSELTSLHSIKKGRPTIERMAIYDTFDWRLFNKSLVLYGAGDRLFLRKLYKHDVIRSSVMTAPYMFIWDFPESELKKHLAPIIKMRALLKLAEIFSRRTPFRILNRDKKTVALLAHEEFRPSRGIRATPMATYLWLNPVKGYPKYYRNLAGQFKAAGFTLSEKEDVYFNALDAADKRPGSYSAKLNIQLGPDMPSDEATKKILQFLVQVMRINEPNIAKDLDTEILHDFRVAVRRTRSALGEIKSVFPMETTRRFKKDFAFVGKLSNQLRDLDVYLLNEDSYKAMLPDVLRDDIDPLFDYLRKKRKEALKEVVRGLKSKRYAQVLDDWEAFLNASRQDSPTASNADLPAINLAKKRIYKQYRKIVKAGNQILEDAEDEKLHALRIECKKLRYLMEFFYSLFSRKKINALIGQLKKLQDNLGDFNDLCVQEEYLLNISGELPASGGQYKKTLVAIGSLVGTLDKKRQRVKNAFSKAFTKFTSPENRELFRELFATKQREVSS